MTFIQLLAEFGVNFLLALLLVVVNTGLVFISGQLIKAGENSFLKALACSIYLGIALLITSYVRSIIITGIFLLGMLPVMKFVYDVEWKEKKLYLFWTFWLVLIMAFFLTAFGLLRILV